MTTVALIAVTLLITVLTIVVLRVASKGSTFVVTEVKEIIVLLKDKQLWVEIADTIKEAGEAVVKGSLRKAGALLLPVLGIPLLISIYFLAALLVLFWILSPFLVLLAIVV